MNPYLSAVNQKLFFCNLLLKQGAGGKPEKPLSVQLNVQLEQVLVIGISSLVMSIIATIIPAITASHINPADALRYE